MELQDALNQILELKEAIKEKEQQIDNLTHLNEQQKNQIDGYTGEITKLKENNMSLFLKVSQQFEEPKTQPNTPEREEKREIKTWDSFMGEW